MIVSKKEIDKLVSKVNKAESMKEKRDATTQLKKIKEELIKIIDYNENIKGDVVGLDNIDFVVDQIKDKLDSFDIESFNIEKKKEMLRLKKNIENCMEFLDSSKAEFNCESEDGEIIDITNKIKKQFTINKILD